MDSEQFRNWIHAGVETWRAANYPALPAFYENGELPQPDVVGARWLDVLVSFVDGEEVTLGGRTIVRDVGTVKLMLYTKAGEGTQTSGQIVESLREYFRVNKRSGSAMLHAPRRHSAPPALGWMKSGLLIPFKNDLQ